MKKAVCILALTTALAGSAHAENAQQTDIGAQQGLWLRAERTTVEVSQAGSAERDAHGVTSLNAVEMLCLSQLATHSQRVADTAHGLIFVLGANSLVTSPDDQVKTRKVAVAELTEALHTLSDEQIAVTRMEGMCPSSGPVAAELQAVQSLLSNAHDQLAALNSRLEGPAAHG